MTTRGGRLPLWAWIAGPALMVIAAVVLFSLLGQGNQTSNEEFGEPDSANRGSGPTIYEITDDPQSYYGTNVTVSGQVSEVLGSNSLLIVEPFGVSADDLLVVSPVPLSEAVGESSDAPLSGGEAVQVTGEVREFELPTIEREIGADLDDELLDYREGTPSIVASSISPAL